MVVKNSKEPLKEYNLYEKTVNQDEIKEEILNNNENAEYTVQNDIENTQVNGQIKEKKERVTFLYHQIVVVLTIAIIFFVINTFTPNLYNELTNYFKKEISIKTNFKQDVVNTFTIIKAVTER